MLKVYTKPNCGDCEKTKDELNNRSIEFTVVDMLSDKTALNRFKALGHRQAPVVETADGQTWSGFNLDKIKSLIKDTTAALSNDFDSVWDY